MTVDPGYRTDPDVDGAARRGENVGFNVFFFLPDFVPKIILKVAKKGPDNLHGREKYCGEVH